MSTELETSYGGVVLRGDELLVITPAGKRVTAPESELVVVMSSRRAR